MQPKNNEQIDVECADCREMRHDIYIFQADVYCYACIKTVKKALRLVGQVPTNPKDQSTYDSDFYPKGPFPDGGGEADSFQHCNKCELFLENPLTEEGVRYTLEAVQDYLETGCGRIKILDQWTQELRNYCLTSEQNFVVNSYLHKRHKRK